VAHALNRTRSEPIAQKAGSRDVVGHRRALLLAAFGLGVLALTTGIASGAAARGWHHHFHHNRHHQNHARGGGLIRSPHEGGKVPARPVLIRVKAGRKAHDFRARLNGHAIGRYFSRPSQHGVRRLKASLTYGLRHGRNGLHVRVGDRSQQVHFQVALGRPLVGAGLDSKVPVGAKVFLKGAVKRPPRRGRSHHGPVKPFGTAQKRSGSGLQWNTSASPSASPLGAPTPGGNGRASFTPEASGHYTLKLSTTAGNGKTASDTTQVVATPAPAMPIDTMALRNGSYGIKVGDAFYPDGQHDWAHLVAIKRSDGSLIKETSYPCAAATYGNPGVAGCAQNLIDGLNGLSKGAIAIVSSVKSQPMTNGPYGIEYALRQANMIPYTTAFTNRSGLQPGAISAIGIPGEPKAGNWHAVASPDSYGKGEMKDYLVRDNGDPAQYTLAASDRVGYDTQAPGSGDSQNVIKVGDQTFTQSFSGGIGDGGGFQVVVLDAQTLQGNSYWFETDHSDKSALLGQLNAMEGVLRNANAAGQAHAPKLIFIASLGRPVIQYYQRQGINTPDDQINTALSSLVSQVEAAGGTRNAFYTMLDPALYDNNSYTLVTTSLSGPAQGEEQLGSGISGNGTGPLNTQPMSGLLARSGPDYTFEQQGSPLVGPPPAGSDPARGSDELTTIAFQAPSPWPEEGNLGETNAIKWIAKQIFVTTDDFRGQYWTRPYINTQFDYGGWSDIAFKVQGLKYPGDGLGFNDGDLTWAQKELAGPKTDPPVVGGEIGWLEATHRYLDALATPFAQSQLQSWAAFQSIKDVIPNSEQPSADAKTSANAQAVFDGARGMLDLIPVIGEGFYAANNAYDMVLQLVEINGQSGDDEFSSTAGQVGQDLVNRMNAAQGMLTRQLPNEIAADYGKLKTVGACASTPPDVAKCPFDVSDWQYTQDDQAHAGRALLYARRVWAWGELLPAKYKLYELPSWWKTNVRGNDGYCGVTLFGGAYCPFFNLQDSAQMGRPIYRNIPTYTHHVSSGAGGNVNSGETWRLYPLGYTTGDGTVANAYQMFSPAAGATDGLFNPLDPNNPNGSLGLDPETFFDTYFIHDIATLDHYPNSDSPTGWCEDVRADGCP
jgi:hypothetical protein